MNYKKYKQTGVFDLNQEDLNDPGTMQVVNAALNNEHEAIEDRIQTIANILRISEGFAAAIWYLRTRSRWTQDLENQLIAMARNNEPVPNMNEYGT